MVWPTEMTLPATVMPFILRGVILAGVDSVHRPMADRVVAWARLAKDLNPTHLEAMMTEITLSQALEIAQGQIDGRTRGRFVVNVNA